MSDNKINKSIRIDEEVVKAIEKLGKEDNRTFSNMVNKILFEYIQNQKEDRN